MEIASNDGYLLQHFVKRDIRCLGIEPAAGVAEAAEAIGVPTLCEFLNKVTARKVVEQHGPADLVIGNNVLAHVPNLNEFVSSLFDLLSEDGFVTLEFPHLLRLMEKNQFDTIYHEHFSYFSFGTVSEIFRKHGLTVFDVEQIPTHGGSLRIYASKKQRDTTARALALLEEERTKRRLLSFLIDAKNAGKSIVGYGAPGKGNTLLNYCGIREDFLDYTVDRNPAKHGTYTPGTRIPIHTPDKIAETKPDFILILPWNLKDEIVKSMGFVADWGGRFVVPIPQAEILETSPPRGES